MAAMTSLRVVGSAFLIGVGVGIVVSTEVRRLSLWLVIAAGIAIVALGIAFTTSGFRRRR
jgi:hypothetical protein